MEDTNHKEGTVKEIQIFYTKLSTIDNQTIVIPNGLLTNNSLTNATAKDERRLDLKISVSYEADLKEAKQLIEEIITHDPCVMKDEDIQVFVDDLGGQRSGDRRKSLGKERGVLADEVEDPGRDQASDGRARD